MRIVILAAGVGSRLGRPIPKPLTTLDDGRSILQRQIDSLSGAFPQSPITIVVGFKKDMVMEAFPRVGFVYNDRFGETNTSKSLLRALEQPPTDSVLWLNGDVVFDPALLDILRPAVATDRSFIAVNRASVGEEEVKYSLRPDGTIDELSKTVAEPLGEAVGVNFVGSDDVPTLIRRLDECHDDDYFERGIELAIEHDELDFSPLDVTAAVCIEVDFVEDLRRANEAITEEAT